MSFFFRLSFIAFLSIVLNSNVFAAASGYVPTAKVTPGATSTTVKTYLSKLFTAPTDSLARIYPSVANGARIGASTVGAVASSVYSGSAAVASKMLIPLSTGANVAINMVGNITKSNLAAAALTILKNPVLGLAIVAGTALYNYYQSSGLSRDANGNILMTVEQGGATIHDGGIDGFAWINTTNTIRYITFTRATTSDPVCPSGWGADHSYANPAYPTNPIPWTYVCKQNIPAGTPLPAPSLATDSQATERLKSVAPPSPAGTLSQIVDNGLTPDTDNPTLTVDSIPSATTTKTNPDGSTETKTVGHTASVSGDQVTVNQTTTTTTRDPAGVVTGVTTETKPAEVNTAAGVQPATDTPVSQFDDSRIVSAIEAASSQAHSDQIAIDNDVKAIPDEIMNAPGTPTNPEIPPDETPAAVSAMTDVTNPFNFNAADYLPDLPVATCYYEIHETFMGKAFDFAPCDKLAPLRAVLAWVFSILTLWSCFLIIFKVSSV